MKTAIRLTTLVLLVAVTWPAAALPQALVCRAVGTLGDGNAFPEGGYIDGSGTCTGGLKGPYTVTIFTPWGSGGVIPCVTLDSVLAPIPVTVTLTNVTTQQTTTRVQEWRLQMVTGGVPVVAFTIRDAAGGIQAARGAGIIVTRVFGALTCNVSGPENASASFDWVFVT